MAKKKINTEVTDFKVQPSDRRIGTILVRYYELTLKCELVIYKKQKMYVRMPSLKIPKSNIMIRLNEWPSQEISDSFQNEVMKQIEEKFRYDFDLAMQEFENFMAEKKRKRNERKQAIA